ncbi:MAG: hypothetical protein ACLSHG_04290 [Oscillospiraceae bacterium]
MHASANAEEDLGPEPDAETAAKYYGGQVKSLRFALPGGHARVPSADLHLARPAGVRRAQEQPVRRGASCA